MNNNIIFGQFYHTQSVIHDLCARTKILSSFLFSIIIFIGNNFFVYGLSFIFLCFIIVLSKIPILYVLKGIKPIIPIMVVGFLFNLLFTQNGEVIFKWHIISITIEGLNRAMIIAIRLFFVITISTILTLTTKANNLTGGISSLLSPLKKIKVPVDDIAIMMSIALRFVPIIFDEASRIIKSQKARGINFENGSITIRCKNLIATIIPLIISIFKRADNLSIAMESRCYQTGYSRTSLRPLTYNKKDFIAYLCMIIYFSIVLIIIKIL